MAYSTIDDPTAHFSVNLWAGNGNAGRALTGFGHQPDFVWIKNRGSGSRSHILVDSVRGTGKILSVDITAAESTENEDLSVFGSDGITVGDSGNTNSSGNTPIVGWSWKAGGSASNNTDGNKTISLSVNTTAGFSVGTYTGDGQDNTIGHGLGAIPDWLMIKNRSSGSRKWQLWHKNLTGTNKYLAIDRNDAELTDSASWDNTAHTSSVWNTYGSGEANQNGENFVCYAWTPIKGFSKFGSYKGNGNADGPMIYTGFKPAWVMVKRIDGSGDYAIMDIKRPGIGNVVQNYLKAQVKEAEQTGDSFNIDILSNGWKVRYTNGNYNADGGIYAYWAFAESPLVNSEGIPNNAR